MKMLRTLFAALLVASQAIAPTPAQAQTALKPDGTPSTLQVDTSSNLKVVVAVADGNGTVVQPALSSAFWSYASATGGIVNTTTAVTIKAAAGAGVRNYVMSMQCSHDTLGSVTELAIRDGASGTVLWRGKLQTAAVEGSATTTNFDPPLKGTANTLVEIVTLTAAVSGGVYCNVQGFSGS